MKDYILYREELQVILSLVEAQIARTKTTDVPSLGALGHLHAKLEGMLAEAPNATVPTGNT